MSNKQNNHKADQSNANKGTSGHNSTYQKAQNNRANQMNPNNSRYQGKK
ncbi:alpha-amylase [Vibrio panuliri]|uniref:Alpha-amylase n=1 Tax=Vibrio panuliri TaxID=1381081 RepID=A0A1Q9HRB8_9VIBR|nr:MULTISPECIES: alpha-amylase [Vibrio]EKO3808753.1 alpha-amylase [Vibrio harveyi]MCC8256231.1 alpha-amylase [Vibrio campbellii CAIM 333]OLQ93393.1 alpha-amylase [Vibrio panuliri]